MTGRSLPSDLQRLLGPRRAAGRRSLSAGISKARSGHGLDERLEGSSSDAPPAPGPRPGPASCAQPGATGLRADRRPSRQHGGATRSRAALPGARRPRSPLPQPGLPPHSRPRPLCLLLCAPRPPPPLARPGSLPGQRRLTRFPSPARRDTSLMLSLSLKQGEKKMHREETRVLSPSETAFARAPARAAPPQGQSAGQWERYPAPSARPLRPEAPWHFDSAGHYSPFPKSGKELWCEWGGAGPLQSGRLRGRGSVPRLTFVFLILGVWHNIGYVIHFGYISALRPRLPGRRRGAPHPTSTGALALATAHIPRPFFPSSSAPRASFILTEVTPALGERGLA